ncbi:MAG: dihydroneopterin aldolase [Pseudomonadota bacterium]|uniref:7,8-dihydroneopterin aldolase n=1 Tax=Gallaecimonas pentaromativorans TaxID=584787 RepID=A0A3N1PJI4_9GAMM|nr:dihydroneopterin aldolase [Gallaecimonas pentaromativorans]MED5524762.1 dihydroneopterin aldolase [Pseudomonadota bacterium]ROQ28763.1 dihydroneopterin aldolase [Gallaecimonas pentaromativorans]
MTDRIFIEGLEVYAVIGIFDWEKTHKRKLVFDLELATDIQAAARGDDYGQALCYGKISAFISQFAETHQFELIETLAERIAEQLLSQFGVSWLKMKLSKPGAVPNARNVGLIIERRA